MTTTKSVVELPPDEQVRMNVKDAGRIYNGHLIFFTNSEHIRSIGKAEHYGVPRAIAVNKNTFYDSGLYEKYNDNNIYGVPYICWVYMEEDQMPPILAF